MESCQTKPIKLVSSQEYLTQDELIKARNNLQQEWDDPFDTFSYIAFIACDWSVLTNTLLTSNNCLECLMLIISDQELNSWKVQRNPNVLSSSAAVSFIDLPFFAVQL